MDRQVVFAMVVMMMLIGCAREGHSLKEGMYETLKGYDRYHNTELNDSVPERDMSYEEYQQLRKELYEDYNQ